MAQMSGLEAMPPATEPIKAASPPNKALHTDGAPVPRYARHGAPRVSAQPFGGRASCSAPHTGPLMCQRLVRVASRWIEPDLMVRAFGWDVREVGY